MSQFKLPIVQNEAVAAFLNYVDAVKSLPKGLPALAATRFEKGCCYLYLPSNWNDFDDNIKREILSHEMGHVVLRHVERFCSKDHEHEVGLEMDGMHPDPCEREIRLWQAVTDAVLNYNGCGDAALIDEWITAYNKRTMPPGLPDEAYEFRSVTFDRLNIPTTRAEIAYDLLKNKRDKEHPGGCGSFLFSRSDMSAESWERLETMVQDLGQLMGTSAGPRGNPHPITGTIPPPPCWVGQIIDRLLYTGGKRFRHRSWKRPNKQIPDLIPGYMLKRSLDALFLLDASGSINDTLLLQLFAAVCSTPELIGAHVVVFDHEVSEIIPASDGKRVLEVAASKRGGTSIKLAGESRIPGVPAVWLTDACSCDGMPGEHDDLELWVVAGNAEVPGREVIRIDE